MGSYGWKNNFIISSQLHAGWNDIISLYYEQGYFLHFPASMNDCDRTKNMVPFRCSLKSSQWHISFSQYLQEYNNPNENIRFNHHNTNPDAFVSKKHKHPNITNISSSQHSEKNWTPFLRNFFDEFIVPTSSHHDPPCSMALSIPIYIYIIINWRFFHPELLFRTAEDMVTWPAKLFNMLGNKCPYTSPNWCLNWSIH